MGGGQDRDGRCLIGSLTTGYICECHVDRGSRHQGLLAGVGDLTIVSDARSPRGENTMRKRVFPAIDVHRECRVLRTAKSIVL